MGLARLCLGKPLMKSFTRRAALGGFAAAGLLWRRQGWAQAVPSLANDVAKAAFVETPDVNADIEEQIQRWLDSSGFAARDGKDLSVSWKIAPVQLPASNPDWVKARTVAVADAYLQAQAEFITSQMQTNITNTVREFTKGPDVPPAYKQDPHTVGQAADVIRKVLATANGQLDGQLREMGIDPQKYESLPEAQKTDLLRIQFKQSVTRKAFGSVAGMTPVMTFEGNDGAKNYQVGVVAVASSLMVDFARQVQTARGLFAPEPTKASDTTRFYKNPEQLLHQFGVRRCFDEQGLPIIVSFAQWGSSYRGTDPAMVANFRDAARLAALSFADGQIADFLKGSASVESTTTTGQEIASVASALPDSTTVEDTKAIRDSVKQSIKRVAAVQISGVRTLHSWTGRHPGSATPILGVIRIWSAASEQNMRAMMNAGKPQPAAAPVADGPRAPSGVTQSQQLMDTSDF